MAAEDGEARKQVEAQRVLGVVVDDLAEERRRAVLMLAVTVEARRAWADLDAEANDLHERLQQEVQFRARLVRAMHFSERIAVGAGAGKGGGGGGVCGGGGSEGGKVKGGEEVVAAEGCDGG